MYADWCRSFRRRKVSEKNTYTSSSMLYVLSNSTSITSLADLQIGTQLSNDFAVMIKSNPVVDKAIDVVNKSMGIVLTREDVY